MSVVLLALLGLAAGVANADVRSGLVGYYPLDEGAGNIAHDMSGNGHDGTLHNGVTWISQAYQGGGVNCDGTAASRIELGTWNPAEGTGQLSLALWIKWAGGGGTYQGLIGKRNTWPGTTPWQFQVRPENGGTFRLETGTYAIVSPNNTLSPLIQTWVHVAATFDGTTARLYLNGEQVASGAFAFYAGGEASDMGIGSVTGGGAGYDGYDQVFSGGIDEVGIYNWALSKEEVSLIMAGYGGNMATNPSPKDKATDVPRDAVLSWDPLATAATRDVYIGTVYDDVNDASRASPGNVLASRGQTTTTFEPTGLDYDQKYYWRVDEVNATPDGTVFKGRVWSFTAEPYAYPIKNLTVKASSQQAAWPATKTIDGLGLNAQDQHSNDMNQTWMSTGVPAWIQYTFDKEYKLNKLWVWNANSQLETYMGFGARDVKIKYSLDGMVWTELEGVPEFTQAQGLPDYTADIIVDFGGVIAKYVKLTINTTWGNPKSASLSEVRFFYMPVQAREPQPVDGATSVSVATDLVWRPGREAQSHKVYVGTDANAVAAGTVPAATLTEPSYTPTSLEFGTTYYWKVDEVGETGTYEGNLWSVTTQDYTITEDFESYTNDSPNRLFQTWIDGWGFSKDDFFPQGNAGNGSGALVGYDPALDNITEHTIIHGGAQSMPLQYDNTASPFYSETQREFATAQNWKDNGASALRLCVRGNAGDFKKTASGEMIMSAIGTDIWDTADQCRYAYKNLTGDGWMVVRVESLARSDGWAKAGVMIRESLHPGSKHAYIAMTPDYGPSFQERPETGNVMSQVSQATVAGTGVVAPYWVKLTRTGNVFTAQQSADGVTWGNIATTAPYNITMANNVLIGLALTSHNASIATGAEFSNLTASSSVTGEWQTAEIGATQPVGNSVEPMYVRIEDSAGASATAVNADEAITLRPMWQEWTIPYSDLAGVNLSRVRTMYIGIGSRKTPTAGGTGTVYIDDIALGRPRGQ
jgi:hypothetical protein